MPFWFTWFLAGVLVTSVAANNPVPANSTAAMTASQHAYAIQREENHQ
jgi:hypothetical protein